ncbi:ATP-binding/permease protein CydD [Pseudoclavibacter triregionum]|nr:ATP-binding/permease protein CydD [Pseudoclavibacter triregionum]
MRPLDPRLLRYASSARRFLVIGGLLGLVTTAAIVVAAWCIAHGVVEAIAGRPMSELAPIAWILLAAVVVRALAAWGMDAAAARAGALSKSELRAGLLDAIAALGPGWVAGRRSAELTTVAGRGLDGLDAYFGRYLPQLLLAGLATPVLIAVIGLTDIPSLITVLCTLPLIPIFMILIGLATERVQRRQWGELTRLAVGFLDVVEGLSTLKIFGRAGRQSGRIRAITESYRASTMSVLRLSFASGFTLELLASLAVAIIAVTIGIRLVNREMPLEPGLFVLLLAPEAYLPLRMVGAQFHAAGDGLAAFEQAADILDEAGAAKASGALPVASADDAASAAPGEADRRLAGSGLEVRGLAVERDGRPVLEGRSLAAPRGAMTAIEGESGAGKSTLLAAIRGVVPAAAGELLLDGRPLGANRARRIAWVGQQPALLEGTIRENLALGDSRGATDAELLDALRLVALDGELAREQARSGEGTAAADPLDLRIDARGGGLSGGQSQRLALARAIVRARAVDAAIVLADEPSSALDAESERAVVAALRALAEEGRAVVVVSHREAVLRAADRRVRLEALASAGPAARDARDAAAEGRAA